MREAAQDGFSDFFMLWYVLQNEGFYGGWSANPATILLKKSNPTAEGRPQTQFGTRYGWPLAHKELLHSLTGLVPHPAGCPYHVPSSPRNLVEEMVYLLTTPLWNRLVQVYMVPAESHISTLT